MNEFETFRLQVVPKLVPVASNRDMGNPMGNSIEDTEELIRRARTGDVSSMNTIFTRYKDRLRRMVDMRLDRRLKPRLDPSDILQEAYIEVIERLNEFADESKMPFFLWMRLVVGQRLLKLHRHHLGTQIRDAGRELSLFRGALPEASSAALAAQLLGRHTSPTQAAIRAERILRLQSALNNMDAIDREVLSLRHFEHLDRHETALALGIHEAAAAKRYIRALKRLKDTLADMPGGLEGL
jgi:RNA polymerase sigma-70 factor (ECF subfamily)